MVVDLRICQFATPESFHWEIPHSPRSGYGTFETQVLLMGASLDPSMKDPMSWRRMMRSWKYTPAGDLSKGPVVTVRHESLGIGCTAHGEFVFHRRTLDMALLECSTITNTK